MKYFVDASAKKTGKGTLEEPFLTIREAAEIAVPGDEIEVAPGIYREYVNPKSGGTAEQPIVYRSKEPLAAVITGAEVLTGWEAVSGETNVWTARVKNSIFGDYNPYTTLVKGDWYLAENVAHTGEIYMNDKSLYEVQDRKLVTDPVPSRTSWDPDASVFVWYTEQDEAKDETVFFANFQGKNPNEEKVEFSARQDCFLPDKTGVNYITVSGFTICKAATQWAPPTAYQDGMIGPHWSKGWIIEDCEIFESKCSGISLGKYLQPQNENKWLYRKYKDGTQTQRECVCQATYEGWDKEHVGSHIVRRCHIHDCGQTGIVGHMGGAFCLIEDNYIHHINNKRDLDGAEIGGIKLHAAVDTVIRRNHFHHCTRGIWLDWQAQGTRVSQNLFHDNCLATDRSKLSVEKDSDVLFSNSTGEDIFLEVSHGPTLIDNNLMLSERNVKYAAQGAVYAHNLFAGSLTAIGRGTWNGAPDIPSDRYTPYHVPHGTQIAGFMTFLHGDTAFFNNIFVQKPIIPLFKEVQKIHTENPDPGFSLWETMNFEVGTFVYDEYPSVPEWENWFDGYCGMNAPTNYPNKYYDHLPVRSEGNVYFGGAKAWKKEKDAVVDNSFEPKLELVCEDGKYKLDTNIFDHLPDCGAGVIDTAKMGEAFEPEQKYENPDGSEIVLSADFFGDGFGDKPAVGPFASWADESDRDLGRG